VDKALFTQLGALVEVIIGSPGSHRGETLVVMSCGP
jgi:hypothetical protein